MGHSDSISNDEQMKTTGDDPRGLLSFTVDFGGFMDTATIIEHLDAEISRLQQAKVVLTGSDVRKAPGRPIAK
jgi:hypothetical protein